MTDLFQTIASATNPNPVTVLDMSHEVDGMDINVSLLIGSEWKDIIIKERKFKTWLNDNDYLHGSEDYYGPENDWKGETRTWSFTYGEFISEHLTDEILKEYFAENSIYQFA